MRKITSHYCLKPDGNWIKRPVIEVDDSGMILNVREMGDAFVEEPGLEYFPGVIVPAFIMAVNASMLNKLFFKRCVANGVRRFICNENVQLPLSVRCHVDKLVESSDHELPWLQIKKAVSGGCDLASAINKHTLEKARRYGLGDCWGAIKEGCMPGLLLLQEVNLKLFELTENTSIRVLVD